MNLTIGIHEFLATDYCTYRRKLENGLSTISYFNVKLIYEPSDKCAIYSYAGAVN